MKFANVLLEFASISSDAEFHTNIQYIINLLLSKVK